MIKDFGEKIDGAAKDRWQAYRRRLDGVEDRQILSHPLSESFPEPNYRRLEQEGIDPFVIAFIRAARDSITAKPSLRQSRSRQIWANTVATLRGFTRELLDGSTGPDAVREVLAAGGGMSPVLDRIRAYELIGHEVSLKPYKISSNVYRSLDGRKFDPPQRRWVVENRKERFFAQGANIDEALAQLRIHLADRAHTQAGASGARRFVLYRYRGQDDVWIGRKFGGRKIGLISFPTVSEARRYLRENTEDLEQRFQRIKQMPAERGQENAQRNGPDLRGGRDISPGEFSATFGFRGVQFGNYVEAARRQQDLNNAFDALMDLSGALGCAPSALSLDGKLGLAFGARGSGGRGAAAAHYEPLEVVINLTKSQGAGSLAHEWFHAIDNLVGRRMGAITYYGTGLRQGCSVSITLEDRPAVETLARLGADLRAAPLFQRSQTADTYRSKPYFSLPHEVGARAFEAWVIDRLDQQGVRNDYLANILPEEVFDAESRLLGLPDNRYPYPRRCEMPEISKDFARCFGPEGAIAALLGGLELEAPSPVWEEEPAAAENIPEPEGLESEYDIGDDEDIVFG